MRFPQERELVVATCRQLADQGFLAGTGGNIALRADEGHLVVTPSATDYYAMGPEDVCVVSSDVGRVVEGRQKPSVETGLHAKVLAARHDCNASIHTHQPLASAYTLFAQPLDLYDVDLKSLLGEQIPCAGYAPSGTSWLANKVARLVKPDVHAYLMRNHGVVCVGVNLDVCVRRVTGLERACAQYFQTQLGQKRGRSGSSATENQDSISQQLVSVVQNELANSNLEAIE